ncbi:putative quinol monooxygenase [Williamsia sterculiae]|uniref:Quinol monooxygenase YgiN n=1 Tax=Williamsia sterculiae TaxID=1344003 RepID=A0A1N7FW79_9NOCA|nr:antibiotic biosynthesis monooxygenase family protein [Williamsia sterculiae]SIS04590.1 Quinol monooxygenase YgiN [Williamsia sterculiae]
MSELHVVATLTAKPGTETDVAAALRTLATATRGESGCIAYDLFESASASGTFVTVERWKDQSDLDAHMKSPHVTEALASQSDNLADVTVHPLTSVD